MGGIIEAMTAEPEEAVASSSSTAVAGAAADPAVGMHAAGFSALSLTFFLQRLSIPELYALSRTCTRLRDAVVGWLPGGDGDAFLRRHVGPVREMLARAEAIVAQRPRTDEQWRDHLQYAAHPFGSHCAVNNREGRCQSWFGANAIWAKELIDVVDGTFLAKQVHRGAAPGAYDARRQAGTGGSVVWTRRDGGGGGGGGGGVDQATRVIVIPPRYLAKAEAFALGREFKVGDAVQCLCSPPATPPVAQQQHVQQHVQPRRNPKRKARESGPGAGANPTAAASAATSATDATDASTAATGSWVAGVVVGLETHSEAPYQGWPRRGPVRGGLQEAPFLANESDRAYAVLVVHAGGAPAIHHLSPDEVCPASGPRPAAPGGQSRGANRRHATGDVCSIPWCWAGG